MPEIPSIDDAAAIYVAPRILSVVTQLESGGAQAVAIDLHRHFRSSGVESELIFLYEKNPESFPARDYVTCLAKTPSGAIDYIKVLGSLRDKWLKFKPTTVFAHTHYSNNMCALLKAAGCAGDLVAIHHNLYSSYPAASRALDKLARRAGLYANEISVSAPVGRSLPTTGGAPTKSNVIPNGQGLSSARLGRLEARRSFGLPEDALILGNIGRLSAQKNQGFLVELLSRMPNAYVAILGEGELRGELTSLAKALGVDHRLILIGAVVRERVPDFLSAIDIFVMPSLFEGMSIAMLEALAAGRPFVGHDIPEIAEVVHGEGDAGAGVVLPLDLSRWVETIVRLDADLAWREDIVRRQIARAEDFSIRSMANRYLNVASAKLQANA